MKGIIVCGYSCVAALVCASLMTAVAARGQQSGGPSSCGDPSAGSCFEESEAPFCNSAACCAAVCAKDPFCCESAWDFLCVGLAEDLCTDCGDPGAGNCFMANNTPACSDTSCCSDVCAQDSFCCDTEWDDICAELAGTLCGNCGAPGSGGCYVPNGTIGCNDGPCCTAVCAQDPFCCEKGWDFICAVRSAETCGNCGTSGAGDCFVANGTIGCDDGECCMTVCAEDPFCCDTQWDGLCADLAIKICDGCPEDLNDDNQVGTGDLLMLLAGWGSFNDASFIAAPLTTTDTADLLELLSEWGACQ